MKPIIILGCAVLLAGCSGLRERSYGTWLDEVGKPQAGSVQLSDAQAQSLREQAAGLKAEAEALRIKLAGEPSRVRRIAYERELGAIGDRLRPIERTLRNAGIAPSVGAARQPS